MYNPPLEILVLIPSWVLLAECIVLEGILLYAFRVYKYSTIGGLALSLTLPIGYYIYAYAVIPFISLEDARELIRYGQSVLFVDLIAIFTILISKGK